MDHSEFIEKHHKLPVKPQIKPKSKARKIVNLVLVLILACTYLGLCIALGHYLNLDQSMLIILAVMFFGAFIGSIIIQKVSHLFSDNEKERMILSEVIEGSRGARLITDTADNTFFYNRKFANLVEEFGEPSITSLTNIFESNERTAAHFANLADQASRGLTNSIELHATKNDRDLWLVITAQPVEGWAGYIHWRVDDITQELDERRSLDQEREKLIDFTDNAPVGFFSVDESGHFVFVNATLARWLGNSIEHFIGKASLHSYLSDAPAETFEGRQTHPYDIIAGGGAKQIAEINMKGPGGRIFLASINQAVVHEEDGTVRTRGVVHDLTAEREMRKELEASEDRFRRFFEDAPLGIALADARYNIKDCNSALAHMLQVNLDDLDGKNLEALVHEEHRETVLKSLNDVAHERIMPTPMEVTLLGKNTVPVQMHARKIKFRGEKFLVLHFIDLTDQKDLEAQFVQSQKMQAVGLLAGGVAHDFNNLLTAIIGFCDLLLLRHKPGDSSFSDIMQIKQNSNRASNLVRQLLAFSRQQTLRPRTHDITDILTELSHLMRRLIGANIDFDISHGQDLGLVKVDEGQMEQVLINLAVNARDAMEQNGQDGELMIRTASFTNDAPVEMIGGEIMPIGQWVLIEVSDTGCGIPEENLSRIFDPFFTTKEVGQGTGLGLATCFGIIRQTGGYLNVSSLIDEGTTFSLYLPVVEEEIEEERNEKKIEDVPADLTGTARILLVEDEDAVRTFSERALTNKGYEVVTADCGENAVEVYTALEDKNLDLLITDVIMPNMDGPTLAKHMREENPKLKIIFISGYTEEKLKDHMGENIWFLPKPFTLQQLAAKVKDVIQE